MDMRSITKLESDPMVEIMPNCVDPSIYFERVLLRVVQLLLQISYNIISTTKQLHLTVKFYSLIFSPHGTYPWQPLYIVKENLL